MKKNVIECDGCGELIAAEEKEAFALVLRENGERILKLIRNLKFEPTPGMTDYSDKDKLLHFHKRDCFVTWMQKFLDSFLEVPVDPKTLAHAKRGEKEQ
jgi:hypothetical protein